MPVSLIYMFVRMLLGALLPGVGRCRQGTRDRRPPSSGGPPSLSSASVVVEEPRADRIDVPGLRCERPSLIRGPARTGRSTDDAEESRSVGLPVFGPHARWPQAQDFIMASTVDKLVE